MDQDPDLSDISQQVRSVSMAQKKEYRNAVRSRRMIREAFVELLHEKPFEKITATDIINRSGLNRSTFYAHYPDVKGIIDEITGEIFTMFRQMIAELDFSRFLNDPEPNLKKVVSFLEENHHIYRLLGQSDMSLIYLEQMKKALIQQVLDMPDLPTNGASQVSVDIRIRMLLSGVVDAYRDWLAGGIDCTLEELTSEVANITRAFSKN
jgi:AcrR family transcriptional regulator